MELSINMNDDRPIPVSRTRHRHRAITSSSSSVASSFLNLICRRRKLIFILLCFSSLLMNQIFSTFYSVLPLSSSSSSDQSPQNPLSNPDFNSTQILKSPIPPIPSPQKTITTQEQFLQISLDSTADSLKISNTHILNLLNNQDLSGEQKNALMICQYYTNERIAEKLQMANRELNKAIDDLDFFLDHETACRRLRQVDMFLTMSVIDQDLCEQNLLKFILVDLKIPISSMLSSSLELAKGIEKDCRKKIEEEKKGEMTNVSPRIA